MKISNLAFFIFEVFWEDVFFLICEWLESHWESWVQNIILYGTLAQWNYIIFSNTFNNIIFSLLQFGLFFLTIFGTLMRIFGFFRKIFRYMFKCNEGKRNSYDYWKERWMTKKQHVCEKISIRLIFYDVFYFLQTSHNFWFSKQNKPKNKKSKWWTWVFEIWTEFSFCNLNSISFNISKTIFTIRSFFLFNFEVINVPDVRNVLKVVKCVETQLYLLNILFKKTN